MTGIVPGCEPWSCEGGDVGVLVLHGFTGNPASMRPLARAMAREGFAVEMPLLPGHGRTWQELSRAGWRDWVGETTAALERLGARTSTQVAVGLSGGGTLALHLAEEHGEDLAGIVMINPSIDYVAAHPEMRLVPLLRWFVPSVRGIGNDIAKPGADELPYPRLPLKAVANGLPFQRQVRENLHKVTTPALVLTSRQDHAVDPRDSLRILDGISSADVEHVWLERSYHVATLDYDADEIERRTTAFVRRVTSSQVPAN